METKKQNAIIIGAAVIISACIWIFTTKSQDPQHIKSRVFKVTNGWGYDVLVNDTIVIHQESVPVLQHKLVFEQKEQAEKTAQLVVKKLKSGSPPTLTKFDLEKILGPDETSNDGQRTTE
ncbi:MAG: DUF4907 domain-containing protein [Bacteroidota bacterium]